jgi:type IV pilus assembly protein PilY1
VAQYYYVNDLRTAANEPRGIDYYRDDVPGVGSGAEDDRVRWQHMTTFSIALGVSGSLQYRSDYKTAATGDFADIRTGAKNWPLWPDPSPGYYTDPTNYNDPRSIDDFWHAAVNGRGSYFSAGNPTSVIAGLAGALAGINARVASSSGVGASNLEPVAGDNFAYLAGYTTQKWTGDVQAHEINISTGAIESPIIWSAKTLLDASTSVACDNRNIMLFRQGATNNLVNFSWGSKRCDVSGNPTGTADTGLNSTEQAHFSSANVSLLSQHPSMTDGVSGPDQRTPAAGANLVNFLRGQRGLEDFTATDAAKLYRKRESVLGDTVNGQPVYVRSPFASFADAGYASFKAAHSGRVPMLYVPANDGMLHAFYAGSSISDPQGGKEAWAVIPSTVLPKLYKLADNNYKNLHEYFVDATPTVADAYVGSTWRTMLVGGLNGGGRGFYALDVTDPASPKGMWEFKWSDTCYDTAIPSTANADCHIGLSFGKPLITKLADGRWVVMVTSGYNNVNASAKTGDGLGYLYVLNAATGEIIYKIATTAGDATTPSGLAQVNNFVEKADIDNTTVRVYGTDLLGNIWRFDVNDSTAPSGREATLVGTAKDALGTPQPITVRPELTKVGDQPMLFVATGKLLGATDVTDLQVQSIYGIVDPVIGTTAFTNLRTALAPLTMTQSGSGTGATRTIACTGTALQCSTTDGWRIDLPDTGERVNVEMKLRAGTLIIGSNVPQISACSAGGYSWLNYLSYKTGLAVTGSAGLTVSEQVANSLIVGLTVIKVGSTTKAIVSTSDGGVLARTIPTNHDQGTAKRVSWREVLTQ